VRRLVLCALVSACGRIGLNDPAVVATDAAPDAPIAPIAYVGSVVGKVFGPGTTDSFPVKSHATGNAVLLQLACNQPALPTATATLTAPGWMFHQIAPVLRNTGGGSYVATAFAAVAPDTTATVATITWSVTCAMNSGEQGDEFTGVNAIDDTGEDTGVGDCRASVKTAHADDALWGSCQSSAGVGGVGSGFTLATSDHDGDASEYALTTAPAGTQELVELANGSNSYIMVAVALAP
jgi:hypothetical protein